MSLKLKNSSARTAQENEIRATKIQCLRTGVPILGPDSTQDRKRRAPRTGLRSGGGKSYSAEARLAARVIKDPISGCWNCQGRLNGPWRGKGYPQILVGKKLVYVHRLAWQLAHPEHVLQPLDRILHSCDNTRCTNPDHLRLGTDAENVHESIHKGRYNAFGRQKLNAAQVLEIRALAAHGVLHKDIAKQFGIARHSVTGIVNRKSWKHLGTHSPFRTPEPPPFALTGA